MNNGWIERLLGRPSFIISFLCLFLFIGVLGYNRIDRKLFPDSNYPEVAVVIVQPGGSARTIGSTITVPVEEELYTLDGIRRVYSTTIDEVTVIRAEFEYSRNLDMAAADVSVSLDKIRAQLPEDILPPRITKISAATAPVVVYAVSPARSTDHAASTLEDIRQIAEQTLKRELLKVKGVANVEIFGGYRKEVQIIVDKSRLDQYGLGIDRVMALLAANNRDYAIGFLSGPRSRYLLRAPARQETIAGLRGLKLTPSLTLADVARVDFGHYENQSGYFGNGEEAIALSIQRGINSDVLRTIGAVERKIDQFKHRYPGLKFTVTDTQKDTIVQSTDNMFESLRDAILMSTLVVFLFLASFRQVLVVLITIPLVYASTVALMWLCGIEFNVVTLTGIILALGLLLDDAVVVMENIERHYRDSDLTIGKAVLTGTREIMFADLSGTVTTMIALAPILFVGGYPQTVFRPLVMTLLLALAASYVISITAVPLLSLKILALDSPWLLRLESFFHRQTAKANNRIQSFFAAVVSVGLDSRLATMGLIGLLMMSFMISMRLVMPTVGRELMPPMDTGGVQIKIVTQPNLPIEASREIVRQATAIISSEAQLDYLSASLGSEPGILSIGSGSGPDHIAITATYVNRFDRDESIWDIERRLRPRLAAIEGIKRLDVVDYGATALSSIRANIDVMLSSSNFDDLVRAGDLVEQALYATRGLVSVSRTWDMDKIVYTLIFDQDQVARYGLTDREITTQLRGAIQGTIVSTFPALNSQDYQVRIRLPENQRDRADLLPSLLITTPKGQMVPLAQLARLDRVREPEIITREGLNYTLNVYGYREKAAISHIMNEFDRHFDPSQLPASVTLEQTGDIRQFSDSAGRMARAIGFAVVLIFFTLIVFFDSVKISLMIVFSIPLTIIGASWTLLLLNYHVSMPAMMGFILLSGIIVNNAILLIHFAEERIAAGEDRRRAMLEAIRIRTRPVLMTAFAVAAGMLPVALGSAIGLERLAPLGAVAIGGLLVGTLLTLVYIPLLYIRTGAGDTKS